MSLASLYQEISSSAVHAAHLTSTASPSPSIFEVVAAKGLLDTLRPAGIRLCEALSEFSPEKLEFLYRFKEEITTTLHFCLELYSFLANSASFGEHFYSMKRISIDGSALSNKARLISAIWVCSSPFLQNQAEKYMSSIEDSPAISNKQKIFVRLLRYLQAFSRFLNFFLLIRYTLGKSVWVSSSLCLMKQVFTLNRGEAVSSWRDIWKASHGRFRLLSLVGLLFYFPGAVLFSVLPFAAFFLQFLGWWQNHNSDHSPTFDYFTRGSNAPPVPETWSNNPSSSLCRGFCPICRGLIKNAVVLPVSGISYCFSCIMNHLRKHGTCPVMHYPAKPDSVVKLYLEPITLTDSFTVSR